VRTGENSRAVGKSYPWLLVGMLWFCGFFNYADRMAVNAVFPVLQTEFQLSHFQLGMIASSFMVVYALSAPLAGFVVDRTSRRVLVSVGLGFWSLICVATGMARTYGQLLFFRAAEGLGESFYFPASTTLIADYHPPSSRSRAMSIHQTSVYVGTAGGVALAGFLAEHFGWRSPFLILGGIGTVYALWLSFWIIEPVRGKSEAKKVAVSPYDPPTDEELATPPSNFWSNIGEIVSQPASALLLLAFVGANFVATAFMTWLPLFVKEQFSLGLSTSAYISTTWSLASLFGALAGGVWGDRAARQAGGRIRVQAIALIAASPFVIAAAAAETVPIVALTLVGVGFCKGVYDASIFASLFDVVRPAIRGTAAGLMNTVGWTGGALAPLVIGWLSEKSGLGVAVGATAPVYLGAGCCALVASWMARRSDEPAVG
jgi:MFS family permease